MILFTFFNRIIIGGSDSYNCIRLRCWSRIRCDVWRRDNMRIDNCFDHKTFHEKVISKRGQQGLLLFRVFYNSYNEKITYILRRILK